MIRAPFVIMLAFAAPVLASAGGKPLSDPKWVKDRIEMQWASQDRAIKPALLDAALELSVRIAPSRLKEILRDESYDARIGSARLAGEFFERTRDPGYLSVLKQALAGSPYQLRKEALYRIRDFPAAIRNRFSTDLKSCLGDGNEDVRRLCRQVMGGQK